MAGKGRRIASIGGKKGKVARAASAFASHHFTLRRIRFTVFNSESGRGLDISAHTVFTRLLKHWSSISLVLSFGRATLDLEEKGAEFTPFVCRWTIEWKFVLGFEFIPCPYSLIQ